MGFVLLRSGRFCRVALGRRLWEGDAAASSAFLLACQYLMFISLHFVLVFGEKHFPLPCHFRLLERRQVYDASLASVFTRELPQMTSKTLSNPNLIRTLNSLPSQGRVGQSQRGHLCGT